MCYSCDATNQQLFAPDNIYKDFAFDNCKRGTPTAAVAPTDVLTLGYIQYGYTYDPYARFGVRFFEVRDTNRNSIPEDGDVFALLLGQLKTRITPHQPVNEPQQADIKLTDYAVRIIKQSEAEEPAKSNVEFILSLFGPTSH